jgi:hypothetical protein
MAFFAEGDSVGQALARLEETKRTLFEDMIARGEEIPPPPALPEEDVEVYSGRLLLRIPKNLHLELVKRAESNGSSVNQYITTALAMHVGGDLCAETVIESVIRRVGLSMASGEGAPWKEVTFPPEWTVTDYDSVRVDHMLPRCGSGVSTESYSHARGRRLVPSCAIRPYMLYSWHVTPSYCC